MATQEKTAASNPRTVERAARVLRSALDEMEYCLLQALDAMELGGAQADLPPSALVALRNLLSGMRDSYEAVDGLIEGAKRALTDAGLDWKDVRVIRVPGAFEIPLASKKVAASGKYDAVIAIGCLIRGETPHFEYISNQTSLGIGQVALETGIPVAFGVITVNSEDQALSRCAPNKENKGYEAAVAAIEMVQLLSEI